VIPSFDNALDADHRLSVAKRCTPPSGYSKGRCSEGPLSIQEP